MSIKYRNLQAHKIFTKNIAFLILSIFASKNAEALSDAKQKSETTSANAYSYAVGAGLGYKIRQSFGSRQEHQFYPELLAYKYFTNVMYNTSLRIGARVGYAWLQPDMPSAVKVEENDLTMSLEGGLVYDWYLVPSISFGSGINKRSIRLKTSSPIDETHDRISDTENLPFMYAQIGCGVPFAEGVFMTEPYIRFLSMKNDERTWLTYGIELTWAFP